MMMKQGFEQIHRNYVSNDQISQLIAFGGPITYLLRKQKAYHLLEQSLTHSSRIIQEFENVIMDHHIVRDPEFLHYLNQIHEENKNLVLFNHKLLSEMQEKREIPLILEINREELYRIVEN